MEINYHKFSSTWELEMAIEDQILHDQNKLPLGSTLWSNSYPLQDHHHHHVSSSSLNQLPSSSDFSRQRGENHNNHQIQAEQERQDDQEEELGAMKEMMFKIAAMQPVDIDPSTIRKPKRRNVRISDDPQSVAARHRRERISEKIRILQRLVPGGTKMDTASMLEEAGRYIKFLKRQIEQLEDNHQPQCIGVMSNFPGAPNYNKPLGGSTGTFSMESVAQTTYTAASHEHV